MKIKITLLFLLVLILPLPVFAAKSAGIKPTSFFYFLDKGFERLNLILTFDPEKKAKKAIQYAEERLAEAEEVAVMDKPEAAKEAVDGYQSSLSLAIRESGQIKNEDKSEEILTSIAQNTTQHLIVLKEISEKVPEQAKVAILKAIEISQKKQEEAEKQIGELRKEVVQLKDEIKELNQKLEEKSLDQKQVIKQAPEATTPSVLASNPEADKSLKELKEKLEKKLKELEKTPTPTPIKVEIVNQNPILVQLITSTSTPASTPTITLKPTPVPTATITPVPTSTPTPMPSPTPVVPGTLSAFLSSDNSPSQIFNWGSGSGGGDSSISKFGISSTNEGFFITSIKIGPLDSSEKPNASANVKSVGIRYTEKSGETGAWQSFSNDGHAIFDWTPPYGPFISPNKKWEIYVNAMFKSKAEGATQDVQFSLDLLGLKAVGEKSGTVIDSISPIVANNHIIYGVYPIFDGVGLVQPNLNKTPADVCKFNITAMGLSDSVLTFDETTALNFSVTSSGQYDLNKEKTRFTIYNNENKVLDTGELIGDATLAENVPLKIDFGTKSLEIKGGGSHILRVSLDNPDAHYGKTRINDGPDYFQMALFGSKPKTINWKSYGQNISSDPLFFDKSFRYSLYCPTIARQQ